MALDPHPDREPSMDARVYSADGTEEYARSADDNVGPLGEGLWFTVGAYSSGYTWAQLAAAYPDGSVVLP